MSNKRSAAYIHGNSSLIGVEKDLIIKTIVLAVMLTSTIYIIGFTSFLPRSLSSFNFNEFMSTYSEGTSLRCNTSKEEIDKGLLPIEITIPSSNIDLVVQPVHYTNGTWMINPNSANYAIGTSMINLKKGNTVIYGKNSDTIFKSIGSLNKSDTIYVLAENNDSGKTYEVTYEVETTSKISKTGLDLHYPTDRSQLTLLSVSDDFYSAQKVVTAKPISVEVSGCKS